MGVLAAATAGFSFGILLTLVLGVGWPALAFALLLAALCLGAYALALVRPDSPQGRHGYLLCVLALACLALGIVRGTLADASPPTAFVAGVGHRVSYEGVVESDPDIRESTARITVHAHTGGSSTGVLAVVPLTRYESVAVGDTVRFTGTLEAPQPFATEGGRVFRYDRYLEVRGIRYLAEYGSLWRVAPAPWYSVSATLARVKHWFLEGLAHALPSKEEAALAGGIVIGGKAGLSNELKDAFTKTGLVQIIVLSGYNVMVVAEWVARFFGLLSIRRSSQMGAGALALLLFVGVAGFSATALRATLMALIALYARATGKSYAANRALLATVLLMLAFDPLLLPYDPGFDLSVVATAGLIWLAPLIEARLSFIKRGKNVLATTLAAQLAVLPLLLYETGNLSLVAIPTNLLVAPAIPLAMAAAALAGVIGALVPPIAWLAGIPAHAAAAYIIFVARASALIPLGSRVLPAFPFALVLLAYAALAAVAASKRASIKDQSTLVKKASTYLPFSAGR